MKNLKVFCNGEELSINGEYVCDCCDSLHYVTEMILNEIGADYEYVDKQEEENENE